MSELKKLYVDVYEKIKLEHHDIFQTQKIGVLYTIILILFDEYDIGSQADKTREICETLNIYKNNDIQKDFEVIVNLLSPIFIDSPEEFNKVFDNISKILLTPFMQLRSVFEKDKVMEWFVVAGCILVGSYVCVKYLEKKKNLSLEINSRKHDKGGYTLNDNISAPKTNTVKLEGAFLYLVVPASSVSSYVSKETLEISSVNVLIDSASYFLCTSLNGNKFNERYLNMTEDPIPSEGQREIIIKIKFSAHPDITRSTTRYELKEYLQANANGKYQIIYKACLKDLAGLDTFIRI